LGYGIHFRVRLDEERLCTLVLMGVREDGTKELIAVEDGFRESAESWSEVLRDLKRRGLQPPALAIGDGALGFWYHKGIIKAVRDVWPESKQQRCWVHKLGNVLDKLPKRSQPRAKQMLHPKGTSFRAHEIMAAESKKNAEESIKDFKEMYEEKYPKAVNNLTKDIDRLLTFFDFPAAHWKHIRSTNAIEYPKGRLRAPRLQQSVCANGLLKALEVELRP